VTSLTWLLLDPRCSYSCKLPLSVIPELRLRQIPELRRFLIPWTSPVSTYPEMDSRFVNRSLIQLLFSRIIRKSTKSAWDSSGFLHECSLLAKQSFPPRRWLTNSANPTFRGCKVFAQFPNRGLIQRSWIYAVTTPPEIIPYYHLNHSIWSLSDNKEVSRWVLPG
jgi:hypothetical protein